MEGSSKFPAFDAETQIDQEATPASRESPNAGRSEPTPIGASDVETVEFHPLANVFPLLEGEEFDRFVEDIKRNGQREPIVKTPDNRILDGRNRYRACLKAGVEPRFETIQEPPEKWLGFVISKNIRRRHLTASQCALAAAELVTTTHGDNRYKFRAEAVPVITQPQAAAIFGISDRLVRDAFKVMEESKELQQLVKDGEAPVGIAADVVRNSPKHVATFIEEVKAGKKPVEAKRKIEAAKESAPVDDSVRVNDADTGKKVNANLAPNRDEECADFLLAEVEARKMPTLISLMESAKLKNVIEIIRRKLQPTPPSDGGATARGQKPAVKQGGGGPTKTQGAGKGTVFLGPELDHELRRFLASKKPAAKNEDFCRKLRKKIDSVTDEWAHDVFERYFAEHGEPETGKRLTKKKIHGLKAEQRRRNEVAEDWFPYLLDHVSSQVEPDYQEKKLLAHLSRIM